jgi:glutamate carboxypeptidase
VLHYIDQYLPETRNLLAESVNINCGTLHKTGVKKPGDIYAHELQKAGFF